MTVAVLTSDRVETAAINLAAEEFSRALGTKASVGSMEYRFPARLAIHDIYIEDRQGDTLAYVGEVSAHFRPLDLRDGAIHFSHVGLKNGVANIYRLPDSTYNYQFLADAFASDEPKEDKPFRSLLSVEDVELDSIRVRYDDYRAFLASSRMDLHEFSEVSLDAEIRELKAQMTHQGQMFDVRSLRAHVLLNDSLLSVPTLAAELPDSRVDLSGISVSFPKGDTLYLGKSAHDITFALNVHEAKIRPADLCLFIPKLSGVKRDLCLHGGIGGTLDSLWANDLKLTYDGQQLLAGNLNVNGLPYVDSMYVRANLQDMHVNARILQDFLSQLQGKPVRLGPSLHRLGEIHYRGLAEGRIYDMTLHGAFRTALGTITTDGRFRSDSLFENMQYNARVVARRFRIGRLVNHQPLGTVTLDLRSEGKIVNGRVQGSAKGHVRELIYNGYTYNDIDIDGYYAPQLYEGSMRIDDPHLQAAFNGIVDLRETDPQINCDLVCEHFDSEKLGIKGIGSELRTRFKISVDLSGVNPDKMSGYLVIDSLFLATARDSILMRQLTCIASAGDDYSKAFTLRSDNLTVLADGVFRYSDIVPALQGALHHYLPSAIDAPERSYLPVTLELRADGQRLRDLQRLYVAPFVLSDHPTLILSLDLPIKGEPKADMRFYAPGVRAGNTPVHDLTVTLNTIDTLRHAPGLSGSGLAFSVSAEAMDMQTVVSMLAFRDTVLTHITLRHEADINEQLPEGWRQMTPRELQHALSDELSFREKQHAMLSAQRAGTYGGDIKFFTHFAKYNKKPLVDINIQPSTLLLRDSVYTIGESHIAYCAADTTVQVEHFFFEGGGQYIYADGVGSTRPTDSLVISLQRIDASYAVPFVLPVQTIMFNGLLTGQADIVSMFRQPSVEAQIHIDSMGLNNCYFGDAEVDLHVTNQLSFHADVYRPDVQRNVVRLDGEALFDKDGTWKLDMMADSVPLAFINHWTQSVLKDLDGHATGHVVVGGMKEKVYVLLNAAAQKASLTLPWTGCRYTIDEDTIVMDTTAILFPYVRLHDAEGHRLEVDGGVYHDQFRDFRLDLHVDVHDALAFDIPERQGELLQGTVYASGTVDVTGPDDDLLVTANAVTSSKSRFRLSIDNVASAGESNFVHFVEHKDTAEQHVETDLDNIDLINLTERDSSYLYERNGRCLLTLNIEVNPKLLFMLVLGERNGDMIKARGNGALRLSYDTETGDTQLYGTYDIDNGTLSYTVANMIRREFVVAPGSTIIFSGDPSNPQLDVTAQYRVTANIKDLFGSEIDHVGTSRTNIPVVTCLHMTGPLNNPVLSFSLEFPLSDQNVQEQVRQVINTDEMLMRQVIYLLVFGRFFTPDFMSNAESSTLNSTYSLLSSTITGQINAWLSKLTDMFTLGVAIRTEGVGADASQEYEASFQLQPVDRLVINGNVGYRYNDISNQPFFGDLDVEVLLTEDGQWRLKGYTHTVDKYTLRQASTIQGVSFMWKKDFNWPTPKRKKKQE